MSHNRLVWSGSVLFTTIVLITWSSSMYGQWTKVASKLTGPPAQAGFYSVIKSFHNGIWAGDASLWHSTDLGLTWKQSLPAFTSCAISDVDFFDDQNGAVAIAGSPANGGIYKTTDGGATWTQISKSTWGGSVCMISAQNIAYGDASTFRTSSDGGTTWTTTLSGIIGIFLARTGNNIVSIYSPPSWLPPQPPHFCISADGGFTWTNLGLAPIDTYSASFDSCNGNRAFLANEERRWDNGPSTVQVTTDAGNNWRTAYSGGTAATLIAGSIAIGKRAVFCPTISSGTLRSLDHGATWQLIGGPKAYIDTRSITALDDNLLVALDTDGSIWRTTNSGGSWVYPTVGQTNFEEAALFSKDTVSICDSSLLRIAHLEEALCETGTPSNEQISGPDAKYFKLASGLPGNLNGFDSIRVIFTPDSNREYNAQYSVTIGGRTITLALTGYASDPTRLLSVAPARLSLTDLDPCHSLDTAIVVLHSRSCSAWGISSIQMQGADSARFSVVSAPSLLTGDDSLRIVFSPDTNRAFSASVRITLSDGTSNQIPIDARVKAPGGLLSTLPNRPFIADTVSTCDTGILRSIAIIDSFCFPRSILSATIDGPDMSRYRMVGHSKDSIMVSFRPDSARGFTALMHVLLSDGTMYDIPLYGSGQVGRGTLSLQEPILNAGAIPFCGNDTMISTSLFNSGCDTIVISGLHIIGDGSFSLADASDSLLAPNASVNVKVLFTPSKKGQHSANLSFRSRNLHITNSERDTTIGLVGSGLGGSKHLMCSLESIDLGSMHACEERDTTIILSNPGCDSLWVTSGTFDNPCFSSSTAYPLLILPHDSARVTVRLDTLHSNGSLNIAGLYTATSDSGTISIPLHISVIPTTQLALSLAHSESATSGKLVTFLLLLKGRDKSMTDLSFDVTHNDDLLSLINSSGPSLLESSGTPDSQMLHYTISSLPASDTIGSLTFKVYLSRSAESPVSLSNIHFDNSLGLPSDCIASISDSGTSLTYLYNCGDQLIQAALDQSPFILESISPNPASDEIRVRVSPPGVQCKVFDALGIERLSVADVSTSPLLVAGLPAGIYYLHLSNDGYAITRKISVIH